MNRSGHKRLTATRATTAKSNGANGQPKRAPAARPALKATASRAVSPKKSKNISLSGSPVMSIENQNDLNPSVEVAAGGESLDKVRDILFGVQMRDYDNRFGQLEERLMREASGLREDVKKRFEALETYIRNEIEAVSDRLKAEHDERHTSGKELTRELRELTKTTEKKNEQLDGQLTKTQRELRQQILDQSKSLAEDIQHKYAEMAAALTRETQILRADKTDRSTLAGLLNEVAMRLTDESRTPGGKTGASGPSPK